MMFDGKALTEFLYSQDLSNCTTGRWEVFGYNRFLYSQDLSNCTTVELSYEMAIEFLYSQDLSNCTTNGIKVNYIP